MSLVVTPSPVLLPVAQPKPGFGHYLAEGYWKVFGREWPPWFGGLLLGLTNFAMFAYAAPWYIYGGFHQAGSWLISFVGIEPTAVLIPVWLHTGWLHDAAILLGAFIAVLMANNFRIRMPQRRLRLVEGFVGGLLMGVGAILAPGSNIGGFFSAVSGLSLSGFVIFFGLVGGVYAGVLLVRWRLRRETKSGAVRIYERRPGQAVIEAKVRHRRRQPIIAVLVLLIAIAILEIFVTRGETNLAVFMLFGLTFGFILQRSGFCMTASFSDMFTTGGGRLARGLIIAIAVAMLGFSILVYAGIREPFVLPVHWHTLVGGWLFGLGMVVAGGCAAGTLFRIGEGSVQLMFALFGAILGAALFTVFLSTMEFEMGPSIWLVDSLGWQGALLVGFAFLGVWFLIVQWNEMRMKRTR